MPYGAAQIMGEMMGAGQDSFDVARALLDVCKGMGHEPSMVQVTFQPGIWVQVVVRDDTGLVINPTDLLFGIQARFGQGKIIYAGRCAHEGGLVTIALQRSDKGKFELRIGYD